MSDNVTLQSAVCVHNQLFAMSEHGDHVRNLFLPPAKKPPRIGRLFRFRSRGDLEAAVIGG